MNESDSLKIARIDQKVISLSEWTKAHEYDDAERFERTFSYVKEGFGKIEKRFDDIDKKLDTLWDDKNQRTGAFNASRLSIGALWAILVLAADWLVNGVHK